MRVKVRSIEPPADESGLEELVVELGPPAERQPSRPAPGAPPVPGAPPDPGVPAGLAPATEARVELVRRPLTAADLGPNGDVVLDLLGRAARLTPAERRALEKEAAWRWWMITPLAGTTMPAARSRALVLGRADGRSEAIVALEAAVAAIVHRLAGPKTGRSRLPASISNAGLAVLVRDLVEPEVFEVLFGPWREVMHH
jgi:hypothetical protein